MGKPSTPRMRGGRPRPRRAAARWLPIENAVVAVFKYGFWLALAAVVVWGVIHPSTNDSDGGGYDDRYADCSMNYGTGDVNC